MATGMIPGFSDVEEAASRLAGVAHRIGLIRNTELDKRAGRRVVLKPELFQISGSFKFRGAYNRISQLTEDERKAGVIAWSSGNHAQGIAAAAKMCGVRARVVVPADAPAMKIQNARELGAEIVLYDRYTESREEIAYGLAERDGGVVVPSFDDPYIVAGQGTMGLELFQDLAAEGDSIEALLVCCGGGGLSAGCSLAAEALSPATKLFTVEPDGFDDYARSLASGEREQIDPDARSVCDALLAPQPGELTFSICRSRVHAGLVVSDDEVQQAMRFAYRFLKLVLEPGGAVALAALLSGKLDDSYQSVGVVLSGGNADPDF